VLPPDEERELVERIRELPLKEFEFHGYVGKRRVMSYGWHYDFGERKLSQTEEIPPFLLPARDRAAAFAGLGEAAGSTTTRPAGSVSSASTRRSKCRLRGIGVPALIQRETGRLRHEPRKEGE
jgi:hypothetical protein